MSTAVYHLARRTDVRLLVIGLGACVAAFAALGFVQAHTAGYALQAFDLKDSDPATRISLPATFTSILLSAAALLAFATSAVDKLSRQARWRRAGWLFVWLAVEELLGVHLWLEHHGVPWIVCYFPLMVIAAAILFDAFRIVSTQPGARAALLAGLITWLFAGAFDTAAAGGALALPEVEILEMGAAALFLVALVLRCQYLARAHHPLDETGTRASLDELAGTVIRSIDLRRLAIAIGLVAGAFAFQYVLLHTGNYDGSAKIAILDLNNEQTLWAIFQGGIIWAVAGLSLLTGALACTRPESRPWWLMLALVLLVLGADEVIGIHDRFQDATGYPGQVILAPVAIVGVIAWLKVLPELWGNRTARLLFLAGAVLWAYSQTSDVLLNHSLRWTITPEELGEAIGSTLWLFSLLTWLRSPAFAPAFAGVARASALQSPSEPEDRRQAVPAGRLDTPWPQTQAEGIGRSGGTGTG